MSPRRSLTAESEVRLAALDGASTTDISDAVVMPSDQEEARRVSIAHATGPGSRELRER